MLHPLDGAIVEYVRLAARVRQRRVRLAGVRELLVDQLRDDRQHRDRLIDRLLLRAALVPRRRYLIIDPGGDLIGEMEQFGVPGAGELAFGALAGRRRVAGEPVEQGARDRHPVQRDQPQQVRRGPGAHSGLPAHCVDRLGGRELRERRLVAVASQPGARERGLESPVSSHCAPYVAADRLEQVSGGR